MDGALANKIKKTEINKEILRALEEKGHKASAKHVKTIVGQILVPDPNNKGYLILK